MGLDSLPHIGIAIFSQTLVIKAVDLIREDHIKTQKKWVCCLFWTWVIWRDSWLPLRIVILSLNRTLSVTSRVT